MDMSTSSLYLRAAPDDREFANTSDAKTAYFKSSEACLRLPLLVYYLQKRESYDSLF